MTDNPSWPRRRRIAWSLAAILAVLLSVSGLTDRLGADYAEAAFTRALVTFAAARTLNGVISVAQGTELAVEPGGVGVIFTLGQILDPINDLVERFSTVMLVATSSLGLQNILLTITAWWGVAAFAIAGAAALLMSLWLPARAARAWSGFAVRLFLLSAFLRFAMPVLVIATNLVFETFLAAEQQAAVAALETTRDEIETINEQTPMPVEEDSSITERLSGWLDRSMASMDVQARLDDLADRVSQATEHIINLIVIFVFQTVLMPLGSLWLLLEILKNLARRASAMSP